MSVTAVKVCCISSFAEAGMAVDAGAHALGLVSAMPSGPGVIEDDEIAAIAARVAAPVETFLLTSRQDAASIIEQHAVCRTTTLQLVDHVAHDELRRIRRTLPGIRLVQVIHVSGPESVEEANAVAPLVDAILLDSGNQALEIRELGGTGRIHDWALSRRIRETVDVPLYLAGGLNSDNVAGAIRQVQPYGVDLCSGIRSEGRLDRDKLLDFFAAVRGPTKVKAD
jgi:phosphoribosylanthranilate isomerase